MGFEVNLDNPFELHAPRVEGGSTGLRAPHNESESGLKGGWSTYHRGQRRETQEGAGGQPGMAPQTGKMLSGRFLPQTPGASQPGPAPP